MMKRHGCRKSYPRRECVCVRTEPVQATGERGLMVRKSQRLTGAVVLSFGIEQYSKDQRVDIRMGGRKPSHLKNK